MSDLHRFNGYKLLAYPDRLDAIVQGRYPYPIDWHIYPSNKCNHACVWCMFRQNGEQFDYPVILPRDLLLRAVEDAARTGAKLIHFSGGGEPLINTATPEAMALAHDLGLKVALSTNGRLLTPEIAAQVDYVRVSLNAGTLAQHYATNHAGEGKGDWQTILDNIAAAVPCRRKDIGLGFVVDHHNHRDILPFCHVAAQLGVDFVHIRPAFYYDETDDQATRAAMPMARALCEQAKRELPSLAIFSIAEKFDGYWTARDWHACRAVLTGVCLRATGDFAVCQDRTDLTFGAAYRAGASFEDVWHSAEHHAVVDSIHDGAAMDACPRCVWGGRNRIIDAWEKDDLRIALV